MSSLKVTLFSVFLILAVMVTGCSSPQTTTPQTTTTAKTTTAVTMPNTTTTTTTATTTPTTPVTVTTSITPTTVTPTTTTETTTVFPTTIYVPSAEPYKPTGAELELFQYMLSLINKDRQDNGVPPVILAYNAAAQKHAQDMFDNYYGSHWGTDGLKPYMRYTLEGGLSTEGENSAYSGWFNPSDNPDNYQSINTREELAALQYTMVYDDAASNWGHRDTMLNKSYTKVSLGIAYSDKRLALVQQFEGEYVEYYTAPSISNGTLALLGRVTSADIEINNISIAYEPAPQSLTNAQLTGDAAYTDGYSLGERINFILSPPPAGREYKDLPSYAIIASKWIVNSAGQFAIQADINASLSKGKGVYTIVIVANINGESVNLTNYSFIVE
ncbi:MAG: CAP domain-containing protein [Dehalococcoidales bacterium]|nr:CAP domain-containing protein [Dehalococcoidales bacterium]